MKNRPRSRYIEFCWISLSKQINNHAAAMKFQNLNSTIIKSNWRLFFLFFVLLMVNLEIQAQSNRPQYWYTYNHTGRFSDRWGYGFDLNHRSNGVVPFNSTLSAARMGMTYHTKTGFRFTAGYAWFGTYVSERYRIWLHENRIYEQAQYTHGNSKHNFVHRIRIEHRWREQFTDINSEATNVFLTNRYRYLFQMDGPIKRGPDRTTKLRWQAANEFFIHNKENVGYMLFDQNRTLAGVMISPKGNLSLAVLYQLILLQQPLLRELQTIHSFRITLFHQLDLRKEKKNNVYEVPVVD
ncbi:DUF2490 domain-containing protein [Aquiflexum balticum]|nr:DUF2490 domain-containing protein [Aquiflexum balticum]